MDNIKILAQLLEAHPQLSTLLIEGSKGAKVKLQPYTDLTEGEPTMYVQMVIAVGTTHYYHDLTDEAAGWLIEKLSPMPVSGNSLSA